MAAVVSHVNASVSAADTLAESSPEFAAAAGPFTVTVSAVDKPVTVNVCSDNPATATAAGGGVGRSVSSGR